MIKTITKFAKPSLLASSLSLIALSLPSVSAPTNIEQDFKLEEVIVTARKRAENLQESPVAISAFSGDKLTELGATNIQDLNLLIPNIEIRSGNGNSGAANIYIRGVGQRNTEPHLDSGVGIYVDGVYLARPDGALLDIYDVESVQVLRGPQGTLFGKNTTGGALVLNSNRPSEEYEGLAHIKLGNYQRRDADLAINMPINEQWLSRVSISARKNDGYIENEVDGNNYIDDDRINSIWQLRWLASDDTTVDFNANWSKTAQRSRLQKCRVINPAGGWQSQIFNPFLVTPGTGRTYQDFCQDSADAGGGDPRVVQSDLGGEYNAETKGLSITANWAWGETLSLKSITAWRNTEANQDDELDHSATPYLHRTQTVHPSVGGRETDQYSQELQLNGSFYDGEIDFVSGVYLFKEKTGNSSTVNIIGPYDPAIIGFGYRGRGSQTSTDHTSASAYAEAEWELAEQWRLTLGARYTWENREYENIDLMIDPATLSTNPTTVTELFANTGVWLVGDNFEFNPNYGFTPGLVQSGDVTNSDITPKASLQYLIGDNDVINNGSVYLTYSEGFRSGGLSEAPSGQAEEFEAETVENLELGVKLDLWDNRLRINAAAFYMEYDNQQFTTVVLNKISGLPSGATINAEASTIKGIELETTWLPIENLELTLNASANKGEFKEFNDIQLTTGVAGEIPQGCEQDIVIIRAIDTCTIDRSDENMARLPERTLLFAAQYQAVTYFGAFIPRLQASWKYDIEYCFDAGSCDSGQWFVDKQFNLDARLTWIPHEQWMVTAYGTNLTDEDYIIGGTALVDTTGVGGTIVNPPKMYGAEINYRW